MPERRDRQFAAKAQCFNAGHERGCGEDYDIIGNLDADATFKRAYFEFLLAQYAADQKLGVAGTHSLRERYLMTSDSPVWNTSLGHISSTGADASNYLYPPSSSLLKNDFCRPENQISRMLPNDEAIGYKDLRTREAIENSFFNKLLDIGTLTSV